VILSPKKHTTNNKINIFMMCKNENDIIKDWVDYHARIFGEKNLYIVDNGSDDGTLEILEKYKNINLYKNKCNFNKKSKIITNLMKNSSADIVFPLDADELIVYDDGKNICIEKTLLYLSNMKLGQLAWHARRILNCIPCSDKNKYPMQSISQFYLYETIHKKLFFPQKEFISVDTGFHKGKVKCQIQETRLSNISLIHYHFRNKKRWLKSTALKLQTRLGKNWDDLERLEKYNGQSAHCAKEYLFWKKRGTLPIKRTTIHYHGVIDFLKNEKK
jgi:glycosyltransferase involved in cell wall biosynthesis